MPGFCPPACLQSAPKSGLDVLSWAQAMAGLVLSVREMSPCVSSPDHLGLHVTGWLGCHSPLFLAPTTASSRSRGLRDMCHLTEQVNPYLLAL